MLKMVLYYAKLLKIINCREQPTNNFILGLKQLKNSNKTFINNATNKLAIQGMVKFPQAAPVCRKNLLRSQSQLFTTPTPLLRSPLPSKKIR